MQAIYDWFDQFAADPGAYRVLIAVGTILVAGLAWVFFHRLMTVVIRRTSTTLDDQILSALRLPVVYSILLGGLALLAKDMGLPGIVEYLVMGMLISIIALIWTVAAMRIGRVFLGVISENVDHITWIEPKTLPLFDMLLTVAVVGGFLYFFCVAWKIPLTSWITSAGIVGIAVGFAAKDTLANLFSGVFIVADSPYQVGDYVVLDNRIRGVVMEIGMRSTRLLTRDDIEVTVPNAVIGNAQIVNETGGPHEKMRVRVKVSVAYGSDVDTVREALLSGVRGVEHVCDSPAPRVRFREFGDSGLLFELLAWIDEPVYRGRVLDELNTRVYRAFSEAGIEIPYSKYDIYIKESPRVGSTS